MDMKFLKKLKRKKKLANRAKEGKTPRKITFLEKARTKAFIKILGENPPDKCNQKVQDALTRAIFRGVTQLDEKTQTRLNAFHEVVAKICASFNDGGFADKFIELDGRIDAQCAPDLQVMLDDWWDMIIESIYLEVIIDGLNADVQKPS